MDAFKVRNYEREFGVGTFVSFRHLSTEEADDLLHSLKLSLELPEDLDGLQVVRTISKNGIFVNEFDANQEDFDLKRIMNQINLNIADKVFVNWCRFDDIDELLSDDLFKRFSDIWYPSSDDIDVFDSSMNWILSIAHCGSVQVIKLRTMEAQ